MDHCNRSSTNCKIVWLNRSIKDIDTKKFETDFKNKIELPNENQNIDDTYQKYLKRYDNMKVAYKGEIQYMVWQCYTKSKDL